jgi:hypothetical protein
VVTVGEEDEREREREGERENNNKKLLTAATVVFQI